MSSHLGRRENGVRIIFLENLDIDKKIILTSFFPLIAYSLQLTAEYCLTYKTGQVIIICIKREVKMKYGYLKIAGVCFSLILTFAAYGFCEESMTITTYYPSPYGVYKSLRLYPNTDHAAGDSCIGANAGEMSYNQTANQVLFCNGSTWQTLGGGVSYTYYCFSTGSTGTPVCTNAGGTQGYCPSGYTQKLVLGSWGYCSTNFWYGGTAYAIATYLLPPGGSCGSYNTSVVGNAYVCSQ